MSSSIAAQGNNRAGLCPHGLVPSACPVCNGGSMGAKGAVKLQDNPAPKPKNNQWSFMKCYAAGLSMRAQERRRENIKSSFERQVEFAAKINKIIQNIAEKIHNSIKMLQHGSPVFIQNQLKLAEKFIIKSLFNILSKIPLLITKMADFEKNFMLILKQAGEKFVSVLGDIKNFKDRKFFSDIKKNIKKFFAFIISYTENEDENYKNDDTLAVFKSRELKKFIVKILKTEKKRNDKSSKHNKNKTKS